MSNPVIPTFVGTLPIDARIAHVQTGHLGTVLDHAAGSYLVRWDDNTLPARWFEGRFLANA